jgi:hypothetical protein
MASELKSILEHDVQLRADNFGMLDTQIKSLSLQTQWIIVQLVGEFMREQRVTAQSAPCS